MVWEAIAEDLTKLGGSMGSEYTTEDSLGLFSLKDTAKKACEKHYKGSLNTWYKTSQKEYTPDLGWVMYHVIKRKVR
jgi:hypothetical protein